MDNIMKKILHIFIAIFITASIATIIALLILKYNIEGENNLPFEISKIIVVSSADGIENSEEVNNKWNLDVSQNNDIYLEISKNKNYKETEIIDEIIIDNFKIINNSEKGDIIIYKPSTDEKNNFINNEENKIEDKLVYKGDEKSNFKDLLIGNQGGVILFRYSIDNLGTFISDDDEIKHDGTLLSKMELEYDELKFTISFDISIKLMSEKTFTGTIELNLPAGNILEEGVSMFEKDNPKDIIFKRNLR